MCTSTHAHVHGGRRARAHKKAPHPKRSKNQRGQMCLVVSGETRHRRSRRRINVRDPRSCNTTSCPPSQRRPALGNFRTMGSTNKAVAHWALDWKCRWNVCHRRPPCLSQSSTQETRSLLTRLGLGERSWRGRGPTSALGALCRWPLGRGWVVGGCRANGLKGAQA